jgi:hypothetical protein
MAPAQPEPSAFLNRLQFNNELMDFPDDLAIKTLLPKEIYDCGFQFGK